MVTVNGQQRHVMGYMKDFLFAPEQARTRVGVLSGGERGRLTLAVALARPSNLLVLDEPTNDLDLETLELLQELLADYPGTVLLVSHDRDFLDRVATSVINAEGDGAWVDYAGGYTDMLTQRGKPLVQQETKRRSAPLPATAAPRPSSQKLTFKDKHALQTLPTRIATLQTDIARHQKTLADPALYTSDHARFARISDALADAETELAQAEERWLELEMLREEVEGR
jgi:ATP-binding cassette subfamily F protein uup